MVKNVNHFVEKNFQDSYVQKQHLFELQIIYNVINFFSIFLKNKAFTDPKHLNRSIHLYRKCQ